ncbi:MAG: fatty acid desaturase family protein [Aquabacterium sp.]|uniref:fatty acid desaturase family protein n=1 Tax=Aquabacterium sp. TaxID=1872578 RepID=UPI002722EFE5|nr:fatty acid desaturase family protein [Aquabacterium sp.]MDO9001902.1 fatty acid desaturase family protein [Aquabacterium sp.]
MNTALPSRLRPSDVLSREEIAQFTARSDLAGWSALGFTWGVIALCFAALIWFPHPLTYLLVVVVLGGRQLALAILLHEGAHGTLFKTRWLNNHAADWLAGRWIWVDVARYREHHLKHHAHTNQAGDPDLSLVKPFPASRSSVRRKFLRDLSGLSGLRRIVGQVLMDMGVLQWTVAADIVKLPRDGRRWHDYAAEGLRRMSGFIVLHALLATALALSGHLWVYSAWWVAYLTTFGVFMRLRSMAEHACTERSGNMLRNTRSTRAGFLARMTVAPIRVNFHIEHHFMASVPYFRLPKLHKVLRERGIVPPSPSYWDVLKMVSSPR